MARPLALPLAMDQTNSTKITISTHNVNGFSRNKEFLRTICDENKNSIRAIQEHWLKPPYKKHCGVNQMRSVHPDFDGFGTSAMKQAVETKVLKGRPYGGTGFLYNKRFANCLKPQLCYSHERVTVMRLESEPFDIMLINVYFPYYNTRDMESYLSLYRDTIGFVENVISDNPECKVMILADFNCNLNDVNHPYSILVRNLMQRNDLLSAYDLALNLDIDTAFT